MGCEFFGEKIIFPSAPVPGINNDQSLSSLLHSDSTCYNWGGGGGGEGA